MKYIHLLENVERDQSNKTRIQILDKNKLQAEFDRLDKNQARNRRFLIWQRNNCLRQNARMCEAINKNKSSGYSSHLKDGEIKVKPQMNKSNRMDLQIIRNKFSMNHPRVPTNEDKQELHWKCHQMLITDKMTIKGLKSNKLNFKTQNKHKVFNENRIKYRIEGEADTTEFYDSLTLFQRIIRGRAYQTMMIMAKIRYHPILHSDERPVTVGTTKNIKEITDADVLEYSRKKFISRFFDALSNEAIHIKNTENKNNMLIRQGNLSRIANEMVERKIRQIEIAGRNEQDEILKQVLKIHEDVSVLFCEKIMEEAVLQSAKEESLKATMQSSKNRFYSIESDKNIERELMSTFIIPEAQRVIFGESQNRN